MLRFDQTTVHYVGSESPALTRVSLTVSPGEIVALVGPSGAGKTTVLSVAAGRVMPTDGSAEVLGVDSRSLAQRRHRRTRARIGAVHQGNALVGPLPVVHNVTAGRLGGWSGATALRSLVKPIGVDEVLEILGRLGIADKLWERTDRLSGGEQQRTAIARALFQSPDLWLVDEPVSALDRARSDAVMDLLAAAVGDDRAMVVSLHDAPLAVRHCHRIVGLREGRILFDLPAAQVDEQQLNCLYALTATP